MVLNVIFFAFQYPAGTRMVQGYYCSNGGIQAIVVPKRRKVIVGIDDKINRLEPDRCKFEGRTNQTSLTVWWDGCWPRQDWDGVWSPYTPERACRNKEVQCFGKFQMQTGFWIEWCIKFSVNPCKGKYWKPLFLSVRKWELRECSSYVIHASIDSWHFPTCCRGVTSLDV